MVKPAASDQPNSSLPATIINALPVGAEIIRHVQAIEALLPTLKAQMKVATRSGPTSLARAFVVLHRLNDRMLSDKSFKSFRDLYNEAKTAIIPTTFEQAGVPNVPLSEGYRVGVSTVWRASVKPGKMADAIIWMKSHGKEDVPSVTINASTLSSLAREMMEELNRELPDDIFNVVPVENATVTKL